MLQTNPTSRTWLLYCAIGLAWIGCLVPMASLWAQPAAQPELIQPESAATETGQAGPSVVRSGEQADLNFWALLLKGGWFMIPIGLTSVLVVTVVIERALALRTERVLPRELVAGLGQAANTQQAFDPREAYRLCQRYPSAAANVVRAMLLKTGRPHSEVEHTVHEASEREAKRLYNNVRWLDLAAGVAPLLGLLGTVWGMIDAFHRTTQLTAGQNKAEELATGIYVALVTTFGGLMVAIPAAVFAHYFEGRIQNLFHQIDELLFDLLPQIERFEGRMRFSRQNTDGQKRDGGVPQPPLAERR